MSDYSPSTPIVESPSSSSWTFTTTSDLASPTPNSATAVGGTNAIPTLTTHQQHLSHQHHISPLSFHHLHQNQQHNPNIMSPIQHHNTMGVMLPNACSNCGTPYSIYTSSNHYGSISSGTGSTLFGNTGKGSSSSSSSSKHHQSSLNMERAAFLMIRIKRIFQKKKRKG